MMSNRTLTLAAALASTVAALSQAGAADSASPRALFHVPAVIGAAYSDRSIATSPAEVRRQGGFATPGAVQWLPAAPTTTEAKAGGTAIELGAL